MFPTLGVALKNVTYCKVEYMINKDNRKIILFLQDSIKGQISKKKLTTFARLEIYKYFQYILNDK